MRIEVVVPLEQRDFWEELLPFGAVIHATAKYVQVELARDISRQLNLDSDDVETVCDLLLGIMDNNEDKDLLIWGTLRFPDHDEDDYETFSLCNRETFHHDRSILRSNNLRNQINVWSCARVCDAITRDPKFAAEVISENFSNDPFVPLSDAERLDWIDNKPTRAHVLDVVRRGDRLHAVDLLHRLLKQPDYTKFEWELQLLYAASFRH